MNYVPLGPDIMYPSDPEELDQLTDHLLQSCSTDDSNRRVALIPHGWYEYAGESAAAAWKAASWMQPRQVVLLLPVHTPELGEEVSTIETDLLTHPLGSHPVDPVPTVTRDPRFQLEEPSLDNSLPFLWKLFGDIALRVLFVSGCSSALAGRLADLIDSLDTPDTLYGISSNMTGLADPRECTSQMQRILDLLTAQQGANHAPLLESYRKKQVSPCGITSLEAMRRTGILKGSYRVLAQRMSPVNGGRRTGYAGCIG